MLLRFAKKLRHCRSGLTLMFEGLSLIFGILKKDSYLNNFYLLQAKRRKAPISCTKTGREKSTNSTGQSRGGQISQQTSRFKTERREGETETQVGSYACTGFPQSWKFRESHGKSKKYQKSWKGKTLP